MKKQFKIKSYGWQELAMCYSPGILPKSASRRLKRWVMHSAETVQRLIALGWKVGSRVLSPPQVQVIVDLLGYP